MRTTLTLDDDVAALLQRFRQERKATLKEVVNAALRRGLTAAETPVPRGRFRTKTWASGSPLITQFDDVAEVLAIGEGEGFG